MLLQLNLSITAIKIKDNVKELFNTRSVHLAVKRARILTSIFLAMK